MVILHPPNGINFGEISLLFSDTNGITFNFDMTSGIAKQAVASLLYSCIDKSDAISFCTKPFCVDEKKIKCRLLPRKE